MTLLHKPLEFERNWLSRSGVMTSQSGKNRKTRVPGAGTLNNFFPMSRIPLKIGAMTELMLMHKPTEFG